MCPPKQAAEALEADSGESIDSGTSDLDSIYSDSDNASMTQTIASAVKDYKYQHGRRYHSYKEGSWPVPNDETQQDHMDIFHEVYTRAKGDTLYVAPIGSNPQRILDLGTGTGIWAMQCADKHASAEVVGNDLSPIQPSWVPPNCSFEVDDFNETWTYTAGSFDLVHCRALHVAVKDWDDLCRQAFKALKPGGYLEVCNEISDVRCDDGTLPDDSALCNWIRECQEAIAKMGRLMYNHDIIQDCMKNAGFEEASIEQTLTKIPLGTWPKNKKLKELGAMQLVGLMAGLEGMNAVIYKDVLGWTQEATMDRIESLRKDMKNRKIHSYLPFHVTIARKPMA